VSHFRRRHAVRGGRETAPKRVWRLTAFNRKRKSGSTRAKLAEARKRSQGTPRAGVQVRGEGHDPSVPGHGSQAFPPAPVPADFRREDA
jgi:hypothetical protein